MKSIQQANDLITSKEETIEGFLWQANEKVERSSAYLDHADFFRKESSNITSIQDIRNNARLESFVISACMLSKKSLSHLPTDTQNEILERLVDFSRLNEPDYIRQLENRYFLTSGDSLGGTMRNIIGQAAQEKLEITIFSRLENLKMNPDRIKSKSGKTVAIKWKNRRIIFDRKPKFIDKSVDIITLKGVSAETGELEQPLDYLCCGELKGGIDPAGADEHWKTAKTALERIKVAFEAQAISVPNLIFIGTAIEQAMANEIFVLLQNNWLAGAANSNRADQLLEVIDILIQ